MEQRRLRLGDILDDYCPRERRVTNHAVVAMIEEAVKQTRCTTCDAEHVYKGGKEPRRRKKDAGSVLYQEVLAGMPEAVDAAVPVPVPVPPPPAPPIAEMHAAPNGNGERHDGHDRSDGHDEPVDPPEADVADEARSEGDDGPFHRRLIRATLPRPEGQKEVRQIPDFTLRHTNGRGGNGHNAFRSGSRMRPQGGGMRRFGGPSTGSGRGPSAGPGRGPSAGPGRGPSAGQGRGQSHGGGRGPSAGSGRGRKRSR